MRIAGTATQSSPDSSVAQRLEHAHCLMVYDTATDTWEVLDSRGCQQTPWGSAAAVFLQPSKFRATKICERGITMRFALPVLPDGRLNPHFGRSQAFVLIDVDPETKQLTGKQTRPAPPHDHTALAQFMKENGVDIVIAGGMGAGMRHTLDHEGLTVVTGAPVIDPTDVVSQYLSGTLVTCQTTCGHGDHHGRDHGPHAHCRTQTHH